MQGDQAVYIFQVPGQVLQEGLKESWTTPNSGWIQMDDGVEVEEYDEEP